MTLKNKAHESFTKRDVPHGSNSRRPDFRDMPKCQARAKSTGAKTERGKMLSKYARLRHGDYSAQVKENRRKINALNRYFRMLGYF